MKKLISFVLAIAVLLSCSMSAMAADYNEIAIGKKAYWPTYFVGGMAGINDYKGNVALIDKNGRILVGFDEGMVNYAAAFADGNYAWYYENRDADGVLINDQTVFGSSASGAEHKATAGSYVLRKSEHIYSDSVLEDYVLAAQGSDYYIYSTDGKLLYDGLIEGVIDRNNDWLELLREDQDSIFLHRTTGELAAAPAGRYANSSGLGVKLISKTADAWTYGVYNEANELQFTYTDNQYYNDIGEMIWVNGYCTVYRHFGNSRYMYYGVIDEQGNEIIPLTKDGFAYISSFEDGVARAAIYVNSSRRWGLINTKGEKLCDFEFGYINEFQNGIASFRKLFVNDEGGYINKNGKVLSTGYYDEYNSKYTLGVYAEIVSNTAVGGKLFALYNQAGVKLTKKNYNRIGRFNEGLAPVLYSADNNPDNVKLGYIDIKGNEVIPCKYDFSYYTDSGYTNEWEPGELPAFASGAVILHRNGQFYIVHNPLMTHGVTASKNASTVMVNGRKVAVDAYTVDGYNYFKLRDVATMLNGTEKQFNVGWNTVKGAIDIQTGKGYSAELVSDGQGSANARLSYPIVYQNGVMLNRFNEEGLQTYGLTAYTIDGNNFFQLRDLGKLLDFNVSYDAVNNCISIDTTKPY